MTTEMQKIERGALEKNLAVLKSKPFLDDAEQQLANILTKKLAGSETLTAMEKALKGPRLNLHSL